MTWTMDGEERFYRSLRRYWHPVLYADRGRRQPAAGHAARRADRDRPAGGRDQGLRRSLRPPRHRGVVGLGRGRRPAPLPVPRLDVRSRRRVHEHPGPVRHDDPSQCTTPGVQGGRSNGLVYVSLDPEPIFPIPSSPSSTIPTYHVAVVPAYDWRTGAARRTENFVDFAHFAWVHDGVLASRTTPRSRSTRCGATAPSCARRSPSRSPRRPTRPQTLELESANASVPGRRNYRVALPFTVWLQQQLPGGNTFVLFMACTPISQKQCRSFTFNARNFALEEDDERFIRFQQEIAEADRSSRSRRPPRSCRST